MGSYQPAPMSSGLDDLLGLGSDGLLGDVGGTYSPPTIPTQGSLPQTNTGGIFGAPPPAPIPPAPAVSFGQTTMPSVGLAAPAPVTASVSNPFTSLNDLFGGPAMDVSVLPGQTGYVAPKTVWLEASKGKGTQIEGTFFRRGGQIFMDMTFTN
ncbi:hypothetical protein X798_07529, partial [Onchocerca flexuosa]